MSPSQHTHAVDSRGLHITPGKFGKGRVRIKQRRVDGSFGQRSRKRQYSSLGTTTLREIVVHNRGSNHCRTGFRDSSAGARMGVMAMTMGL